MVPLLGRSSSLLVEVLEKVILRSFGALRSPNVLQTGSGRVGISDLDESHHLKHAGSRMVFLELLVGEEVLRDDVERRRKRSDPRPSTSFSEKL